MGTEIEQAKLQEMGKLVNDIDRELKIDYEDYVTKYWFDIPYNSKASAGRRSVIVAGWDGCYQDARLREAKIMKSHNNHSMATLMCLAMSIVLTVAADVSAQHSESIQNSEAAKALQTLRQELTAAGRNHAERLREAKSDEERNALRRNQPYRLFEPRFLALARRYENDDASFAALTWLVETASPGPVFDQGLAELQEHYLEQEEMPEICRTLVDRLSPGIEPFLRHVAADHSEQDIRALALMSLARHLARRLEFANSLQEDEEKWMQWARSVLRDDVIEWMRKDSPRDLSNRIEAVCKAIIRHYRDLPDKAYRESTGELRTLGDAVHALQFSLDPVGRAAPRFIGKDAKGELVSSEELRGKIVLLMFSADWCGPCKAMYGQLRELMEIYADKPFSVVTVMADNKLETVAKAVKSGEITWPAIWDGRDGPIASAWHVTSYPSIYLIDREGLINSNGLSGDALDDEVARLLGIDSGRDKRTRAWRLSFRDQGIDGDGLPTLLDGYTELRRLDLGHNQISDEHLVHLQSLKKLTVLNLEHTGITDDGLKILQGMSSLQHVQLYLGPDHKTTKAGRRALRKAIPGLKITFITH